MELRDKIHAMSMNYSGHGVGGRLSVSDVEAIMIDLLTMQQMHTAEFHAIKGRMERTDAAIDSVNARLDSVERRLDDLLISMSQLLNWINPR
ncbi:hypothetical protein OG984_27675 [Nocardioides sp. NBC_00368]|uniref:Uncharacterized protein n=2 Tax=Nocardioides TaxID=1839 RepID=A0A6M1QQL1_9ACTN|nr:MULTISPECIES: hypothetical protein [Nocardioides]EGD41376.1 hypothetical protein NBCG_04374 [Nocardioidaceae bacterium Broad-1]MBG6095146.1 tetrahydromethanopterin S-methyltransferase subunit G [Nocardioides luteus]NGN92065.1 hypothetical protein [Nocardioides sp. KC13]